jgi:Tfp pilus assembly protein PilF
MYPSGSDFTAAIKPGTATESINVDEPDFNTIRGWFRSGRHARVRRELNRIYEKTSNSSSRARALYYLYVLEQRVGNHEKALSNARTFLRQFDDHSLHPEVLFGAWFLSKRLLDRPEQAQQYEEQLRSEYPESKWIQKIDS